jgi:diguanylate cyclase (GGDEF)-like protein
MALFPALRRTRAPAFDRASEQQRVTEAVLRSAAALLQDERHADDVVAAHCESLTTLVPHLVLAWVWFGPADTTEIRPQVISGHAAPYARELVIQRNLLTSRGPAFRTLAGGRLEPFQVTPHSVFGPWREAARRHEVRSVLALPLSGRSGGSAQCQRGLFVLYADVSDYFDAVGVGVFEALAHLFSAVLMRGERDAELARAANCDGLTGLANRQGLAVLEPGLRRLTALDPPCTVLMIDIDHFKRINDEHGHAAGDRVLCAVATVLRDTVRGSDAVARWGGEEFVICLPRVPLATARLLAEKLVARVAATPLVVNEHTQVMLTLSVGAAELRPGEALATAIASADAALYAAKRGGRNRVVLAAAGAEAG